MSNHLIKQSILIVDDTPENLHFLNSALMDEYVVSTARNGSLALRLAAMEPQPDLIILDIVMPGMDGYEVCQKLKMDLHTRDIPVIFVTAMSSEKDELYGFQMGAIDYISRPISKPIVKSRVRTHLTMRKFMLEMEEQNARLIQARKNAEEMAEKAALANKAKSDFLANMSHEIRTPMNVVLGMSEVLLDTNLEAEQRRLVQIMQRSGRALLAVINDVLDFSRIEAGRFTISELPFSPRQVVEETAYLMQMVAEEKGLTLQMDVVSGIPSAVLGDDGRVRQVLINLLGNAIKFTQHGQVSARLSLYPEEKGTLLFSVADTGIGIAPEHVEHIFEYFTQADTNISRRYGGTGLGLAISEKLVELMGGRIWVESQLGQGSTFFFTLPERLVEVPVSLAVPLEQTIGTTTRTLRILIAEDSPDNRLLLQMYLKRTPHHLTIVNDGLEAVSRVREEVFDLLLTDIEMPNMDGYAATRAIRHWEQEEGRRPLTIMALSAHAGIEKKGESLAAGCDGHLTKPIKKQALIDAIQQVAESISRQDLLDAVQHVQDGKDAD